MPSGRVEAEETERKGGELRQELLRRAGKALPALRQHALEAPRLRRVPDESIAALAEADLFRLLQPKRFGGAEADFATHLEVVSRAGKGCASAAWVLGVFQVHSWLMALFPAEAQEEVWGANEKARICAVVTPRGQARRTGEGFRLEGFWPFASGCQHAQWALLGASVTDESGEAVDKGLFAVPIEEVEIQDDWNVGGLRGTGSHSLVVKNGHLSPHRFLSMRHAMAGKAPGVQLNGGALYRAPVAPALVLALSGPALGTARMALEVFQSDLPGRIVAYTRGEMQEEMSITHRQIAEAATKIDAASLLLRRAAEDVDAAAKSGGEMTLDRRGRVRMDVCYAVRQCLEAADVLYTASGGSGLAESSLVQLAAQDLRAMCMHGILNLPLAAEVYGRVKLGFPADTPFL